MRDNTICIRRIFAYVTAAALLLQLLLFVVSWLIAAAMPDNTVRSLLGNEGIRWFFGSFVSNVASKPLVWILVVAMAWGAIAQSGIARALVRRKKPLAYRQRFALRAVLVVLLIAVVIIILLAFVPNAPLRSVTGQLFPSSFSRSLIPMLAFCAIVMAVTYGLLSGAMRGIVDVFNAMAKGIQQFIPLFILYVAVVQLFYSIIYVFQL
ncbi:MAG: AbgT family transporter [Prevotella sp.]|nr:AbgT family transporter [Prevotella sp.]